eukprot:COSAG02_NODE_97_length_37159_cov_37.660335_42_plen_105_part_00
MVVVVDAEVEVVEVVVEVVVEEKEEEVVVVEELVEEEEDVHTEDHVGPLALTLRPTRPPDTRNHWEIHCIMQFTPLTTTSRGVFSKISIDIVWGSESVCAWTEF